MRQRFIQSFSTSGDVQTALDNETLGKPYVALVSGSGLDYNTMSPTGPEPEPEPLPEPEWVWSDIEDGKSLVFNDISDTCPIFVDDEEYPNGKIATIKNAVYGGNVFFPYFAVSYNDGYPYVELLIDGDSGPESIWKYFFDFEDGQEWSEEVTGVTLTAETASEEDALIVSFDGQRTFTLTTANHEDGITLDMTTVPAPPPYACKYIWECDQNDIKFPRDTDFQEWDEFTTLGVIKNTSSGEDVKIMVGPAETQPATGYSLKARLAVDGPSGEDVLWEREMHFVGEGESIDFWADTETGVNLVADGFPNDSALLVAFAQPALVVSPFENDFPFVIERVYDKPRCNGNCE